MDAQIERVMPKPGEIIRLFEWCGIVHHIYLREDKQDAYLEIWFVKNIFKQQKPELQLWSKIRSNVVVATRTDVKNEISRLTAKSQQEARAFLAQFQERAYYGRL